MYFTWVCGWGGGHSFILLMQTDTHGYRQIQTDTDRYGQIQTEVDIIGLIEQKNKSIFGITTTAMTTTQAGALST